jgi:hypothetical protein
MTPAEIHGYNLETVESLVDVMAAKWRGRPDYAHIRARLVREAVALLDEFYASAATGGAA